MKITVTISDANAALIQTFLDATRGVTFCTHGPLDMAKLTRMLLEDVALMVRRPGSWEGSNMATVMTSHGYISPSSLLALFVSLGIRCGPDEKQE